MKLNRPAFTGRAIYLFSASACAAALSTPAYALTAAEVFEKVSRSVWAVRALDADERPHVYGSGVTIGPGRMVTNCHVIEDAKIIQVRRENVSYEAKLEYRDRSRDLCTLAIANFTAPSVEIANLSKVKVGERAYAIGNPIGLALTVSEGLVSGLRSKDGKSALIQTTAAISPGSSGGGLFDDHARLIGVTTLGIVGIAVQNVNFAVPAEWIGEIETRVSKKKEERKARLRAAGSDSPANDALPLVGTTWKYAFRDQLYSHEDRIFSVETTGVKGWEVNETLNIDGGAQQRDTQDVRQIYFTTHKLYGTQELLEFSPYLVAKYEGRTPSRLEAPGDYPLERSANAWSISTAVSKEDIWVPAGRYQALRVDVSGERDNGGRFLTVNRFLYQVWYVPEVGRYVKIHHQSWDGQGDKKSDDLVQLLEFRSN